LDTYLYQSFDIKPKPVDKLILEILNSIKGLDANITIDPDNEKLTWVKSGGFKILSTQNVLDYINSAITQSSHRLLNWWVDLFGVLHVYRPLTPKGSSGIKWDFNDNAKYTYSSPLTVNYIDPDKYRAKLYKIDPNNPRVIRKVVKNRIYKIKQNKDGSADVTVGGLTDKVYTSDGVLTNGNDDIKEILKVSCLSTLELAGTWYYEPQASFQIINSPFGDLDAFTISSVTIRQDNAFKTNTTIELESGTPGYF